MKKNPHAVALGRRGGKANTPAQQAVRLSNRGGGRPQKYRLVKGTLEKLHNGRWLTLEPPYDRPARAALYRLRQG